MENVGESLKREREIRGMTLDQVAEATGVSAVYLGAMERSEFAVLPGRAFGKLYIRAYAEVLEFDPRPLIESYDRENRPEQTESQDTSRSAPAGSRPVQEAIARWKAGKAFGLKRSENEDGTEASLETAGDEAAPLQVAAIEITVNETASVETAPIEGASIETAPEEATRSDSAPLEIEQAPPSVAAPTVRRIVTGFALLAGALLVLAVVTYLGFREPERHDVAPTPPTVQPRQPDPAPVAPAPPAERPPVTPVNPKPSVPGTLTVPESAVGRRIVNFRLDGESDRFVEGDVVVFQTRVLGGKRGDRVRHVWMYDGRIQQSIELRLGGADWRTHSRKTLYRAGPWTVEARDGDGRVLATAAFTCGPRGR